MKREKERNAKKASVGSPRPPKNSVTQQSGGAAQVRPSSQPHAAVSTLSTTSTVATPSAATPSTTAPPDVTMRQAGRWTRFWLRFCCTSTTEYSDDHH
ncbi:hypothetical protein K503DRAFT_444360 [Rhizopogon vinicolor AM-OR11-026]|uniref:Uncharacterized protein n=1 Tax=Rhizopogon vinicolor AM-OR11-026 TaxID=1314800 RepID=A0A1B7MP95_9AGAM|nr:hypothetical protein K503DRAFT_444360 [Rhizopogon vinicolor AM-OR11-026]